MLTFRLSLPWQSDGDQVARLYDRVLETLRSVPGVEDAALTDRLPLDGETQSGEVHVPGLAEGVLPPGAKIGLRASSVNFHQMMKVQLIEGRYLEAADATHPRTVINEAAARAYFRGIDPVGRLIRMGTGTPHEIVGVVANLPETATEKAPAPAMYVPFQRTFWPLGHFVIRTRTDPSAMADEVRRAVAKVDSGRAIELVQTVDTFLAGRHRTARIEAVMVGAFALIALLLAAVGIFGLVTAIVHERTSEIAIRMALGAEPAQVLRETLGLVSVQLAAGVVGGLVLALLGARAIQSMLYGVPSSDGLTMAASVLALMLVALGAAWVPARRAARVDPAIILRGE